MKTESKTSILRNLRAKWTDEFGQHKQDLINSEILKLSMKSGSLTEADIAVSLKKMSIKRGNYSSPKPRATVGTTSAQNPDRIIDEKLYENNLRSSVNQKDDIAVAQKGNPQVQSSTEKPDPFAKKLDGRSIRM